MSKLLQSWRPENGDAESDPPMHMALTINDVTAVYSSLAALSSKDNDAVLPAAAWSSECHAYLLDGDLQLAKNDQTAAEVEISAAHGVRLKAATSVLR